MSLQDSSGVCFLVCLLMMLLDACLYWLIGVYLDKVCFLSTNKEKNGVTSVNDILRFNLSCFIMRSGSPQGKRGALLLDFYVI